MWNFTASLMVLSSTLAGPRVDFIAGQAELGTVEFQGVGAGTFNPADFRSETSNFIMDVRTPLIIPRLSGAFRNIYAPSVIALPEGWRVFFGGWDGVPSGNDRIYSLFTADFLDLGPHRIEVEHGDFQHVCNVTAARLPDGALELICTAYPANAGTNKPIAFASPDGLTWNGRAAPYPARRGDLIELEGYPGFEKADTNGVNVLLHEGEFDRLYFGDFTKHTHIHRASSSDGKHFRYDAPCLASNHMVNDVKKFTIAGKTWYMMGLHANGDHLWYTLSEDGLHFGRERELARAAGHADKYIVAIGWVVRDQHLLGFLYGAGPVPSLDRNRVFARWLQKKLVFTDSEGREYAGTDGLGPDRQLISLGGRQQIEGRLAIYAEDGKTRLGEPIPLKLVSGGVYVVRWDQ